MSMTNDIKNILELKIKKIIDPLIGNSDYVFWDIPFYTNTGDILIYRGTIDYLKKKKGKCLDIGSRFTANLNKVNDGTIILLCGGGNFGDIYGGHNSFRLKVVEKFPKNRIIIMPQSIHYNSIEKQESDFKKLKLHNNLYVLLRDNFSLSLAKNHLPNNSFLCPDMAFCISNSYLEKYSKKKPTKSVLFFKRTDVEKVRSNNELNFSYDEIGDWPLYEKKSFITKVLARLVRYKRFITNKPAYYFAKYIHFPVMMHRGLSFLSKFDTIYSDRLHGTITAILLKRKIIILDNSYGKSTRFYNTFLKQQDSNLITIFEEKDAL